MARTSIYGPRAQLSIRLPQALVDELTAEANRRLVSINLLVESAIVDWLTTWNTAELGERHVGAAFAAQPPPDHFPTAVMP